MLISQGETYVTAHPGSWTQVAGVAFGDKASALRVTASSAVGCTLYAVTGSRMGPIAAQVAIPAGTDTPTEFTVPLKAQGTQDLYFVFNGEALFFSWRAE